MHAINSPGDWLKQIQDALADVREQLRNVGARNGEPPYTGVFKALRRADQLVADAMRRIDVGQPVSSDEFDAIAQIFEAIKSSIFCGTPDQDT